MELTPHLGWDSPTTLSTFLHTLVVVCLAYLVHRYRSGLAEAAVPFTVPLPEALQPDWSAKAKTLASPSIKVSGSSAIQCYAPATAQLLGLINPLTADGIDRAIVKATNAQVEWATTTFVQRRRLLNTLLQFILDNQDVLARAACLDSGKTRVDALFGEILVTVERIQWTIDHGEKALKPERRPTNFLMFYKRNEVHYEPLGVVAACVSWNYPFHQFMGPVISSLFSGNALVIKTSEQTAWSTHYFCSIVRAALTACDHDPNLVQPISCWPDTANHLTSHPGIKHITFIGSRTVAHEVARSAAKSLTPLCVELGGKDAAIVLDNPSDAPEEPEELQRVASTLMRGVFQSAGQNCIGIERIIAMPQAYTRLLPFLRTRIQTLRLGNDLSPSHPHPIDVGAMISPASFPRLESLISAAVAAGASLLVGGTRHTHPDHPQGHYFSPTLLADVTPDMRIAQEELFAPICLLMRAASPSDAVRIANSTPYGLGSSVFGPTTSRAARAQLRTVASALQAGMVAINDFAVYYAVQLPFGGVKGSGYGRFAGEEGLRSLCNVKSVCVDRWPGLIKTSIPRKLDYPMKEGAFEMGTGVVEVGYGSWRRKVEGLMKML